MGRIDRVNQQMKREVGIILLQDLSDPRFQFVSVTHVSVSPDLHNARVYFSVLGDAHQAESIAEGLNGAKGMVRKLVGSRMRIRYTPEITFIYDEAIESSIRMEETLKEIHEESKSDYSDNREE